MPDYEVKEWNETNSPLDNSYTRAAYGQKHWAKLSNYVRLHALYAEGGIYLDTDVEVVRTLTPLLRHECFLGFQVEEENVDWVNNAVLGARPGHHFLRRGMELTVRLFEEEGEFYRSPAVMTAVLKGMGLSAYGLQEVGGVNVYPAEYFYPYPWFGEFTPGCVTENTFCVHRWAGSWMRPGPPGLPLPRRVMRRLTRALARDC